MSPKYLNTDEPLCLAVMYHYVRDRDSHRESGISGLSVSTFEKQLDVLCADMEPIDWPMFHRWQTGQGSLPERCLLLTFDDGLSDHADVVAPILNARGLRGVFFLSSECMTTGRLGHAHQVHALLSTLGREGFAEEITRWLWSHGQTEFMLTETEKASARSIYHYESALLAEVKYLVARKLPREIRNAMLDELVARHIGSGVELARRWYMSLAQITILQAGGHTLGGHGHGHEALACLSPDEQLKDMERTAVWLDDRWGHQPRPMSYPYGSFDDHTTVLCQQAGFAGAFTTNEGWNRRDTDPFRMRRVDTIAVDSFLTREVLCLVS